MSRKFWGFLIVSAIVLAAFITSSPTNASKNQIGAPASITAGPAQPVAKAPAAPVADQVNPDDSIIQGSLCVGADCVNGEAFNFDTIRLKENNVRLKFQDTSSSASFPTNDWSIVANDSANGGNNYLAFEDVDGGNKPFLVEARAGDSALYVKSGGDVGLGTSAPATKLHIVAGDTPTVRFEQNGSQGWTPQTWDVGSNETNYFVRDYTNNGALIFRIFPGTKADSMVLKNDNVGIGTGDPAKSIHIAESAAVVPTIRLAQESNALWDLAGAPSGYSISDVVNGTTPVQVTAGAADNSIFIDANGNVGIGNNTPTEALYVTGNVHVTGNLTQASDRNLKENIESANKDEILEQILDTPIYYWNYIDDSRKTTHLGPMAQDFFANSSLGTDTTISPLDVNGALIASIQALHSQLEAKDSELDALAQENAALEERLAALEAAVAEILAAEASAED